MVLHNSWVVDKPCVHTADTAGTAGNIADAAVEVAAVVDAGNPATLPGIADIADTVAYIAGLQQR